MYEIKCLLSSLNPMLFPFVAMTWFKPQPLFVNVKRQYSLAYQHYDEDLKVPRSSLAILCIFVEYTISNKPNIITTTHIIRVF